MFFLRYFVFHAKADTEDPLGNVIEGRARQIVLEAKKPWPRRQS